MNVSELHERYGNQIRLRVCGVLTRNNELLMVKHEPLGTKGFLWSPPGGKVEFGKSAEDNLIREMKEETNLEVTVGHFLFVNEYIQPPIHTIELFFEIKEYRGILSMGKDPELPADDQLIKQVEFINFESLKNMHPLNVHNIIGNCKSIDDLLKIRGFFKFENYSTN